MCIRDRAKEIIKTDDDVDRFSLYAVRQLRFMLENENSLASLDSIEKGYCLGYRMVSKNLERIADHANLMGEQLLLLDKPLPKNIISQLEEFSNYSRNNLDKAVKALLKKDYTLADEVISSCLTAAKKELKILNSNVKLTKEHDACLISMLELSLIHI